MITRVEESGLQGKRVLVQVAADVPFQDGQISDDTRLRESIPTITWLLERENTVILCGHVGRPKGVRVPELSCKPVAQRFSQLINKDVLFIDDDISDAGEVIAQLSLGSVCMLENLRYNEGETAGDETFGETLASLADAFVNDDFPDSHRASATNCVVPTQIPSYLGMSLEKEWRAVHHAVDDPQRPFVLIVGGAKADKIGVINNMLGIADHIIVGGVLANTFLAASGVDVKGSKIDERSLEIAGEFLRDAEEKFCLPVDAVVAEKFDEHANHKEVPVGEIPEGWMILDVGTHTVERYKALLQEAGTVVWGGPIGVYEWEAFRRGTEQIAQCLAAIEGYTLIGGGDSGDAVNSLGLAEKMDHVSIGGGATLALVSGEELPAIVALDRE